jgi:predicted nucleic acid-binding protein
MGRPFIRNLIDTNVWIDAIAGNLSKKAFLKFTVKAEWAGYSAITRLELFGFPKLTVNEEAKINEILQAFDEVPVNSNIIDCAIEIRRKAKIKIPDAIIGATALVRESHLITRNVSDFKGIDGLKVIDPFAD